MCAFLLEFHIEENLHIGRGGFRVGKIDRNILALDQQIHFIRLENAGTLMEGAFATAPAGHHEKPRVSRGEALDHDGIEESDQDKLAIPFLADVIAQDGGLQIGLDHVHGTHLPLRIATAQASS